MMNRGLQGRYVNSTTTGEVVRAFVPSPLPPDPPITWTPGLQKKFDQAHILLGRLDSAASMLPDTSLFLYMYVRKEAVLSSMIEGTQSSLSDLLLFELDQAQGVPLDDVGEVSNYVAALYHGLQRLEDGLPLSLRLMREMHRVLLASGRGSNQTPGEFRRSQNWIGGTRPGNASFVPPPPEQVPECMGKLELFLHDQPEPTPVLLKAALAHLQFETIHPFLDGNGRLGRLLIPLLLCEHKVLRKQMLYLSLCFKLNRQDYYRLLDSVRQTGDWESWLDFFADAVIATATQAMECAQQLASLASLDREKISDLGRIAKSALQVHRALLERPIATSKWLVAATNLTPATVNSCINQLAQLGVVKELTGKKRNRLFSYPAYLEILNRGTEPLGD